MNKNTVQVIKDNRLPGTLSSTKIVHIIMYTLYYWGTFFNRMFITWILQGLDTPDISYFFCKYFSSQDWRIRETIIFGGQIEYEDTMLG